MKDKIIQLLKNKAENYSKEADRQTNLDNKIYSRNRAIAIYEAIDEIYKIN